MPSGRRRNCGGDESDECYGDQCVLHGVSIVYAARIGFSNLPEDLVALADRLGTKTIPPHGWVDTEHLRKWCLCETNWCDVYEFDFDTKAEAMRLAKFYRDKDDYAQINVRGTHVTIKTAKSQSAQAMSKEPFEASKRDVLDLIEVMVGVKRGSLMKEARPRRRA